MRAPTLDVNIAPARQRDYGDVVALLEAAALPTEDLDPSSMAHFLVARDASARVISTIGYERYGRAALLRSLAVARENRNRNLGTQIVAALEAQCRSLAVTELFLLTTTARNFFLGQGYEAISREAVPMPLRATAEFTKLCPDSAHCMTKSL